MSTDSGGPLDGIRVVDFTTLAPGPLASLILAGAGAEVVKVERPGIGDEMRIYKDAFGDNGCTFNLLNAGKRSVVANLRDSQDVNKIKKLIEKSDVVLEQFRPGVLKKYGLDYESLRKQNPTLIYCSITGFGQTGTKTSIAAHDLNYVADSGMLSLGKSYEYGPAVPPVLTADLAAGTYPAIMNMLLAIIQKQKTGEGAYIDISMTDNLFPLMFWALGLGWGSGEWPQYGDHLLSGRSPRYQVYKAADGRYISVAALEERFWNEFCDALSVDPACLDEMNNPQVACKQIQDRISCKTSKEWEKIFNGKDVCAVVVKTLDEAIQDNHYQARKVFERQAIDEDGNLTYALPLPIVSNLQKNSNVADRVPKLGEDSNILDELE